MSSASNIQNSTNILPNDENANDQINSWLIAAGLFVLALATAMTFCIDFNVVKACLCFPCEYRNRNRLRLIQDY